MEVFAAGLKNTPVCAVPFLLDAVCYTPQHISFGVQGSIYD